MTYTITQVEQTKALLPMLQIRERNDAYSLALLRLPKDQRAAILRMVDALKALVKRNGGDDLSTPDALATLAKLGFALQ